MSNLNDYLQLIDEIWRHNKLYYVDHAPEITDEAFDHLLKKLEAMEKAHPEWISPTSPTGRVMESLTEGFKTITHQVPMLSLANTYSKEEVALFIKRVDKLTGHAQHQFSVELKMDGIAISATYVNGRFSAAATRGDGQNGDDITVNLKTIANLPLQLHSNEKLPELLELRGEVFMPHKEFERLNDEKRKKEEPLYANPRNAAAGSLKMLDPKEVSKRKLLCVFYGVAQIQGHALKTQFESHQYIKSLGIPTLNKIALCHNLDEIFVFADAVQASRNALPFDIDGIVIKLNNLKEQEILGASGKAPRFAVAYKFAAEQAETKIKDITVQVGRTGVLTPVAELVPVFLSGSTIARATLHNQEEIDRKDIRIHDIVRIEKGGDVIPKVVEVNYGLRPTSSVPWTMPKLCPCCHTPVVKGEGEVAYRCPNIQGCGEQVLRRIIYFAGKDALDIENFGEKVAEMLFKKDYNKTPADIYALTAKELATLDNFKEKSINNLLESIEKSKKVSLDRFIMALGIKHIGEQTAELIASKAGTLASLIEMTKEEFLAIEGIGDKAASALIDFFHSDENRLEIQRLIDAGVTPEPLGPAKFANHFFEGKICVLTGTLTAFSRMEAAKLIKERGGKVVDQVTKKTQMLIAGKDPGSKVKKAKSLNIPILTEDEFFQLINT